MNQEYANYKNIFRTPPCAANSFFVSFEGIEGAGKSTQVTKMSEYWNSQGFTVKIWREPGGTDFGEKLRQAILNRTRPLHPLAEAHLFASARAELLYEEVLPWLEKPNTLVVLDRYIDSSLAYQGVAGGLGVDTILSLHAHYPLYFVPHLTFYLQISPEVSYSRQLKRQQEKGMVADYFERRPLEFYEQLVKGLDESARLFPTRVL